jgi:hypothetical protein
VTDESHAQDAPEVQEDGKRLAVRLGGSLVAGGAFLAILLGGPWDDRDTAAWGFGLIAAVVVVAAVLVGVRLAARPGRPPKGRLTADYLALFAGTTFVVVAGIPLVAFFELFFDTI